MICQKSVMSTHRSSFIYIRNTSFQTPLIISPPLRLFPPPLSPQAKERQIEEWSGAESPVSELMRTLQDNRRLSTELADARAQLSAMDVFNSKNGTTTTLSLSVATRTNTNLTLI